MNPKFFRNGIVMLVLVVGTAALLFTWINSTHAVELGRLLAVPSTTSRRARWTTVVQQGETLTVNAHESRPTTYTVTVPSVLTQVLNDMVVAAKSGGNGRWPRTSSRPSRRPTRRGSGCC